MVNHCSNHAFLKTWIKISLVRVLISKKQIITETNTTNSLVLVDIISDWKALTKRGIRSKVSATSALTNQIQNLKNNPNKTPYKICNVYTQWLSLFEQLNWPTNICLAFDSFSFITSSIQTVRVSAQLVDFITRSNASITISSRLISIDALVVLKIKKPTALRQHPNGR